MRSSQYAKSNANGYGFTNTNSDSYTHGYGYTNSYGYTNGNAHTDADSGNTHTYTNLPANTVAANYRPRRGLDHCALCERHDALRWQLRAFYSHQYGSRCGDALPEHRSRAALDAR